MSGFMNNLHELHQQHRERHEARHEGRGRGRGRGHHDDYDDHDNHGPQRQSQRPYQGNNDDDAPYPQSYPSQGERGYAPPAGPPPSGFSGRSGGFERGDYATDAEIDRLGSRFQSQSLYGDDDGDDARRSQSHQHQGQQSQGRGYGYAPPSGPPPSGRGASGFGSLGGLDRGDFASDADIDRMVATGEFNERQTYGRDESRYGGGNADQRNVQGREGALAGGVPRQGYGERANEYGRSDAPSGPPSGRGYQSQQYSQRGDRFGDGGSDRLNEYGSPQTQGRTQYDSTQGPPFGNSRGQGNAPAGGFTSSRDGEERYGGQTNYRNEPPRRGEAASFYDQQSTSGQGDRYAHLAGLAQEHGNDDPELYRRATQGLQERMQAQAKSRPGDRDDEDDYRAHVDAHRKAYGNDDHGPMDNDSIGQAAALEAFKQTAAAAKSSNAPAGAFKAGKATGDTSSQPGRVAQEEETTTTERGRASGGGMQDKLVALAMAQAGKLFDKKNAGSSGDKSQDKAQAMQSAAATAMQLFGKYKTKGSLDSGDMSTVMGLAMKML